ncbi:MAG TPA: DNA repair protein RadA [Hyphomicrobiaceae bacterium]|nr:DNA repair protein RadA [Hyphomicrobiaceae bacterium]
MAAARAQRTAFVCQSCGASFARWAGRCSACDAWNSLVEEVAATALPGSGSAGGRAVALESLASTGAPGPARSPSGNGEFDRVTGGGIVPGSVLLVGGEPGIGKSTLLLELAARVAAAGRRALYISGEEAAAQVRLRAERLGVSAAPVALLCDSNLGNILATLQQGKPPDLVIVDSIQTLWSGELEAAPGSVAQVRAAAHALVRFAKAGGSAVVLVGHVTKDGQIAGPKLVEHMVDTVLYFEGDRGHPYRILRAAKNRFGATDEIGVFEMAGEGLREVANPSELFLGDRRASAPGAAVFAGVEGTRPILVEIQALVVPSELATPRRAVVGWDASRLAMLLAVISARANVSFAGHDVYLNVAGGLKISEPAADLAAAAALISSLRQLALRPERVYLGEIALSGAVRAVRHTPLRLKEARKLGFKAALVPAAGEAGSDIDGLERLALDHVAELAQSLGEPGPEPPAANPLQPRRQ